MSWLDDREATAYHADASNRTADEARHESLVSDHRARGEPPHPLGAADGSSPIISQRARSGLVCALLSRGSAELRAWRWYI